jgi:hypothetical protein
MMVICAVCGNEVNGDDQRCPFCRAELSYLKPPHDTGAPLHKTVNLKQGLPTVAVALARLEQALRQAGLERAAVVTVIHGYGSSGKGGAIRLQCRKMLDHLVACGHIKAVIAGEDLRRHSGAGKDLWRRFPDLDKYLRVDLGNPGITIIVLR